MISISDVEAAAAAIKPWVRQTPVLTLAGLQKSFNVEAEIVAKLESLQITGSFKARGAMNRFLSTPKDKLGAGLVTASGGNHGIAVARTAYAAGVPATIFLPSTASPAKLDKIRAWNAKVEVVGDVWDQSNAAALSFAARTGAEYLHPFADPLVVAGQGTVGLEILAQIPDVDTILVAIGGGGLIAGILTAVKARNPAVRIVGIEPTGSPTLHACLAAKTLVTLPEVTTRVATMACRQTDPRIYEIVQAMVDDIVLVTDAAMEAAAQRLWFETGLAADLSGAASIAALAQHPAAFAGSRRICALVCGAGPEGVALPNTERSRAETFVL